MLVEIHVRFHRFDIFYPSPSPGARKVAANGPMDDTCFVAWQVMELRWAFGLNELAMGQNRDKVVDHRK